MKRPAFPGKSPPSNYIDSNVDIPITKEGTTLILILCILTFKWIFSLLTVQIIYYPIPTL